MMGLAMLLTSTGCVLLLIGIGYQLGYRRGYEDATLRLEPE